MDSTASHKGSKQLSVLLVEDNDEHATIISRHLRRAEDIRIVVARAACLSDGLAQLAANPFDALLLDLQLPDSQIEDTLSRTLGHTSRVPIIVISTVEERSLARKALHEGAQDYLCKTDLSPDLLCRAIEYAIERKHTEQRMREEVVRKQALFDFGQQALSEHAVSSLLDKAASTLSQALQVEFVKIMEFLPHEESFILRAGRGWKPHFMGREKVGAELNSIAGFTLRASRPTIPGDLRTLEPVMIEDLTTETRFSPAPFIREHGIRSGVSVLIHGKDQEHPYGILGVHSTEKRCFSADEAQFLQAAANVLAAALLRMRLEDELLRSAHTLEERVKQRTADLEESKDALEAFGYSVSHDLRAPLRTMQGFANALLEDYADVLDGEGRDYAARISRGARRMDLLIEDLLTYSRLSRGDITLKPLDLVPVLQEAQRQVEAALAETGGTILIHPPDVPLVFGHEATLVQVFANLLSNALKFVEPHVRPSVTIRTEQRGAWVTVTVTDNGIGVEPAHQDEIFSVFQRLHGSERYPGTGIGLAIVKKGVERLGGRVGVTSHTGQGSSFWVELRAAGSLE